MVKREPRKKEASITKPALVWISAKSKFKEISDWLSFNNKKEPNKIKEKIKRRIMVFNFIFFPLLREIPGYIVRQKRKKNITRLAIWYYLLISDLSFLEALK